MNNDSDSYEYILDPKNLKFTTLPIEYPLIFAKYKDMMASFWKAEEIDFEADFEDFQTLSPDEQYFIKRILAFFAQSDGIVNFNLSERFTTEIKITEIIYGYQFQIIMENIHAEVYSLLLDNIVKDSQEKSMLFNAIETIPSVKNMADWAFKWIESTSHISYRIVAFIIVEGIFFSGAFAAIFWLKKYKMRNKAMSNTKAKLFMNGLISANKLISRDERLHYEYGCEVYKLLAHKLNQDEINEMLIDSIKIAQQFMSDALPVRLIGMNQDLMNEYIEYIGDRLLLMLGYKKIFNKNNPFSFMKTIGLNDKSNLHEVRPTEYQDSHIKNKKKEGKHKLFLDDDF